MVQMQDGYDTAVEKAVDSNGDKHARKTTGSVPHPGVTVFLLEYFCDGAAVIARPRCLFVDVGRIYRAKCFGVSVA